VSPHSSTIRGLVAALGAFALAAACSAEPAPPASSAVRSAAGRPRPVIDDPSRFGGTIELGGELARAERGSVLVMLRAAGQSAPLWAYFVDLRDPAAERNGLVRRDDGSRALYFTLDRDTTLIGAPLPHDTAFEIAALYDPDGDIDSKDGQVRASAPARRGDLAIRMELAAP
jgi:hypothetical protein